MTLTEDKLEAIRLLSSREFVENEIGYADVAEAVGVTPKTLYNWRQTEEFQDALNKASADIVDETLFDLIRAKNSQSVQAARLFYQRKGLLKDEDQAAALLQMTDEEKERIARHASDWLEAKRSGAGQMGD